MKRFYVLTTLLFLTMSLFGQGNRNTFVLGAGMTNPFATYVEEKPGPVLLIGYERTMTQSRSGFESFGGLNYQYHNFTSTRTRGILTSSVSGRRTYHKSHEASLHQLAAALGIRQRIGRFSFSAFVEGTYLLRAKYRGFSGETVNEEPQAIFNEFEVSLNEGDENDTARYRIRPEAHRVYANVGGEMSYQVSLRWEVALRYINTLGYQEIGLETAPLCPQQSGCGEFNQNISDVGGNDRGALMLLSKFSF
jgi:hypothetical protein